jgi:hypothetical protein
VSRHEDDRAAAVDNAEATLLGFFTQYEWDTATSPVAFRRALEMLWEDGATIGFHEG